MGSTIESVQNGICHAQRARPRCCAQYEGAPLNMHSSSMLAPTNSSSAHTWLYHLPQCVIANTRPMHRLQCTCLSWPLAPTFSHCQGEQLNMESPTYTVRYAAQGTALGFHVLCPQICACGRSCDGMTLKTFLRATLRRPSLPYVCRQPTFGAGT